MGTNMVVPLCTNAIATDVVVRVLRIRWGTPADEGRKYAGRIDVSLQPVFCENYAHLGMKNVHIRVMSRKCIVDILF